MNSLFHLPILVANTTVLFILYGIIGAIAITIIVFLLYFLALKQKGKLPAAKRLNKTMTVAKWFEAVGGKDNVVAIKGVGSRLNFLLKDQTQISRGDLEQLGAKSVLLMVNKVIVVMENQAEKIATRLNQEL